MTLRHNAAIIAKELQAAKLTITAQGDVIKDLNEGVLTATAALKELKIDLACSENEAREASKLIALLCKRHHQHQQLVLATLNEMAKKQPKEAEEILNAYHGDDELTENLDHLIATAEEKEAKS